MNLKTYFFNRIFKYLFKFFYFQLELAQTDFGFVRQPRLIMSFEFSSLHLLSAGDHGHASAGLDYQGHASPGPDYQGHASSDLDYQGHASI